MVIAHGFGLSNEYTERYGKTHTCEEPLLEAEAIFYEKTGQLPNDCYHKATQFPRAMPEEWKFDDSIDTFVAYKDTLHQSHGLRLTIFAYLTVNLSGYD